MSPDTWVRCLIISSALLIASALLLASPLFVRHMSNAVKKRVLRLRKPIVALLAILALTCQGLIAYSVYAVRTDTVSKSRDVVETYPLADLNKSGGIALAGWGAGKYLTFFHGGSNSLSYRVSMVRSDGTTHDLTVDSKEAVIYVTANPNEQHIDKVRTKRTCRTVLELPFDIAFTSETYEVEDPIRWDIYLPIGTTSSYSGFMPIYR